jgi:hypothetical protein
VTSSTMAAASRCARVIFGMPQPNGLHTAHRPPLPPFAVLRLHFVLTAFRSPSQSCLVFLTLLPYYLFLLTLLRQPFWVRRAQPFWVRRAQPFWVRPAQPFWVRRALLIWIRRVQPVWVPCASRPGSSLLPFAVPPSLALFSFASFLTPFPSAPPQAPLLGSPCPAHLGLSCPALPGFVVPCSSGFVVSARPGVRRAQFSLLPLLPPVWVRRAQFSVFFCPFLLFFSLCLFFILPVFSRFFLLIIRRFFFAPFAIPSIPDLAHDSLHVIHDSSVLTGATVCPCPSESCLHRVLRSVELLRPIRALPEGMAVGAPSTLRTSWHCVVKGCLLLCIVAGDMNAPMITAFFSGRSASSLVFLVRLSSYGVP